MELSEEAISRAYTLNKEIKASDLLFAIANFMQATRFTKVGYVCFIYNHNFVKSF